VVQSGSGTLLLTATDAYTGGTTISAGTLAYGINNALPANGAVTVSGGVLNLLAYSGSTGAVTLTSGTIAGTTGVLNGTSYAVQSGYAGTSLGGTAALTKTTAGLVTLSGSNSFAGGSTISAGTLEFANIASMPSAGTVSVANAATLAVRFGSAGQTTSGTSGAGSLGALIAGTGLQGSSVAWSSSANLGIDTSSGNATYAGAITNTSGGALGVYKLGANMLTLAGSNTYSDGTTVTAGTLTLAAGASITDSGSVGLNVGNGVVNIQGLYNAATSSKVFVGGGGVLNVSGSLNYTGGGLQIGNVAGTLPGSGTLNVTAGSLSYNSPGNQFNIGYGTVGVVNLTGGTINTPAKVDLGGSSSSGTGTLNISGSGVFIASTGSSFFTLGYGGTGSTGVVNLGPGGLLQSVIAITGGSGASTFNFNGGTLQATAASAGFLSGLTSANVQAGGASINDGGNAITIAQNLLSGASTDGGLYKSGAGTLSLAGSNSYNGPTTIVAGTLALGSTGSINRSSSISIASGATFDVSAISGYSLQQNLYATGTGTATIRGALNAAGKMINLEDGSIGTLAVTSNLTLGSGTLAFDVGSVASDLISIGGSASMSGLTTISLSGLSTLSSVSTGSTAYALLTATGGGLINSDFQLSSTSLAIGSLAYTLSTSLSGNTEYLSVTPSGGTSHSATGIWISSSGSTWGVQGSTNWNSGTAPGTSAGYTTTDTAIFSGSGSVTTVNLAASNPSLASLSLSGSNYTLTGGSLTLAGSAPAITVTSGSQEIASALVLASSGVQISLVNSGSLDIGGTISDLSGSSSLTLSSSDATGILSLSGSNSFGGGVYVASGTLILNGANALLPGSTLTIGSGTSSVGGVVLPQAVAPASQAAPNLAPVPEPGTLALLATVALWSAIACYRFSKRPASLNNRKPS
jgi:autotransporter-associated beta strand protein